MNLVTSYFAVRALASAFSLAESQSPSALPAATLRNVDAWSTAVDQAEPHVRHRQDEYDECVRANARCPSVSRILLVVQDELSLGLLRNRLLPSIGRVEERRKVVPVLHRSAPEQPSYADLFRASRMLAAPSKPTMVCNSDIYLPAAFNLARVQELVCGAGQKAALALTRYEDAAASVAPLIDDYRGSHDAFVFRPADLADEFLATVGHPQNCYKAENIVIHELTQAGFVVRNPCYSVRIVHLHAADVRQWLPPVDESRYGRAYPET